MSPNAWGVLGLGQPHAVSLMSSVHLHGCQESLTGVCPFPKNLSLLCLLTSMYFLLFLIPVKDFRLALPDLSSLPPPSSLCRVHAPMRLPPFFTILEHAGEQCRPHVCLGLLSCIYPLLSCMQCLLPL